MSPSRHLSQEELQMLLGTTAPETTQSAGLDKAGPFPLEGNSVPDSVAFLKDSIRVLSARVELLESELSLLRSQLTSHMQAAEQSHQLQALSAQRGELQEPHATIPQTAMSEGSVPLDSVVTLPLPPAVTNMTDTSLTPRSVKHRKKKGIITKLFE